MYRDVPAPVPLRGRQHASCCCWCRWMTGDPNEPVCREPHHNPTGINYLASNYNNKGQCDRYVPSHWTRLLQFLRIRPFVERERDET
jgi:hypothetical protein